MLAAAGHPRPPAGPSFGNQVSGLQFNSPGGVLNANTGDGNQFNNSVFQASVHFYAPSAGPDDRAGQGTGLKYRDYGATHTSYHDIMTPGTCEWVLQSPEFTRWRDHDAGDRMQPHRTLLCRGEPGTGKTFVATAVIQNIREQIQGVQDVQGLQSLQGGRLGLAFAYFSHQDERSDQQPKRMLCNLFGQLLPVPDEPTADKGLTSARQVYDNDGQAGRAREPSFREIQVAFACVAKWYKRVFVVVDALDECRDPKEREEFLIKLGELQSAAGLDIRLFATSRLQPTAPGFEAGQCLCLEILARDEDVRKYLETRMRELRDVVGTSSKSKDGMKDGLVAGANGVFLVARLYMDQLVDLTTPGDVSRRLDDFRRGKNDPKKLDKCYEDILVRMERQDQGKTALAKKALMWVTFATRALTSQELRHALAVDARVNAGVITRDEDVPTDEVVIKACYGLLRMGKGQPARLSHPTVKEYLMVRVEMWSPRPHWEMAETCAAYLCDPRFARGPFYGVDWFKPSNELDKFLRESVLLRYASSNWAHHLSQAEPADAADLLLLRLSEQPDNLALSFQIHLLGYRKSVGRGIRPTHIVSYLGTPQFVCALHRSKRLERKARDGYQKTGLHWAAEREDEKARGMVEALLKQGFKINAADSEGRTPLHYAAASGNVEMVRLLLKSGANADVKGYATPLFVACSCGHAEVAKTLLANGADINMEGGGGGGATKYGPPLAGAIQAGSEECVRLLLADKHLKKDAGTYKFGSALHDAASYGLPSIVRSLLDEGFDPTKQARGSGDTPLYLAVSSCNKLAPTLEGSFETVKLLLARTNRANAAGSDPKPLLATALANENEELAELLRKHGAVEMTVQRTGTTLSTTEPRPEQKRLPRVFENNVERFMTAMLLGNDAVLQDVSVQVVRAFKKAIQAKNMRAIAYMSQSSILAFERTLALARQGREGGEGGEGEDGGGQVSKHRRSFTVWLFALVFQAVERVRRNWGGGGGGGGGSQRGASRAHHAAGTASSKLELLTEAAVEILTAAIQSGNQQIVLMLSDSWVRALSNVPTGGPDDQMMKILVSSRAKELVDLVRSNKMDEAHTLANVGLELVASAIERRSHEPKMADLAISLSDIFSLAVHGLVGTGTMDYTQLAAFLRRVMGALTAGFADGDWTALDRFGAAAFEVLVAVLRPDDEDGIIAHLTAQAITEGWQLAIQGGGEQVDEAMLNALWDDIWKSAAEMMDEPEEGLDKSRIWDLVGAILKMIHVSVRHGLARIAEKVSDRFIGVLDQAESVGNRTPTEATRRHMLVCILVWCKVDASPAYYLETALILLSAARKANADETIVSQLLRSILSEDSPERVVLANEVKSAMQERDSEAKAADISTNTNTNRDGDEEANLAVRVEQADQKLSESLGVDRLYVREG